MRTRLYFDVVSPFTVLAWRVLRRYQRPWAMQLEPVPIFLGGVMKATGNRPPGMLPQRAKFQIADLQRSTAFFNVPMLPVPTNFFTSVAREVISAQRLICAAQRNPAVSDEDCLRVVDELMHGLHADPQYRDANNDFAFTDAFFLQCLDKAGLADGTADALLAQVPTPEVKQQLVANTEDALANDCFGSPTMLVTPEGKEAPLLFFGSDRFEQMAFVVGKEYAGPDPN